MKIYKNHMGTNESKLVREIDGSFDRDIDIAKHGNPGGIYNTTDYSTEYYVLWSPRLYGVSDGDIDVFYPANSTIRAGTPVRVKEYLVDSLLSSWIEKWIEFGNGCQLIVDEPWKLPRLMET